MTRVSIKHWLAWSVLIALSGVMVARLFNYRNEPDWIVWFGWVTTLGIIGVSLNYTIGLLRLRRAAKRRRRAR